MKTIFKSKLLIIFIILLTIENSLLASGEANVIEKGQEVVTMGVNLIQWFKKFVWSFGAFLVYYLPFLFAIILPLLFKMSEKGREKLDSPFKMLGMNIAGLLIGAVLSILAIESFKILLPSGATSDDAFKIFIMAPLQFYTFYDILINMQDISTHLTGIGTHIESFGANADAFDTTTTTMVGGDDLTKTALSTMDVIAIVLGLFFVRFTVMFSFLISAGIALWFYSIWKEEMKQKGEADLKQSIGLGISILGGIFFLILFNWWSSYLVIDNADLLIGKFYSFM